LLRNRRFVFPAWALLALVALILANQNWYAVGYQFGDTTKTITATGASAWPTVNGASWFWVIGLAGMTFTRNKVRTGLAALLAIITAAELLAFTDLIRITVSPSLNSQIEKASGISGGGHGNLSSAITQIAADMALPKLFIAVAILLLALQVVAIWASLSWKSAAKADKYAKPQKAAGTKSTSTKASVEKGTAAKTKPAKTTDTKGDAISLWDSQR